MYYLVNKDRINNISAYDCILLNISDEMSENYILRAKHKYVYLEKTEDTSGEYFSSYYDINSDLIYDNPLSYFRYKGSEDFNYKMIPTTEFTIGSFQIIMNSNENIFNEVDSLKTDQINSYKVFVDGYDLKNNLEISRKLFCILRNLQSKYSSWYGNFPYISYNSFHDKTLDLGYENHISIIRNCNSIITPLGARLICNWRIYDNQKFFVKELPNEDLHSSYTPIIMYEKDINNKETSNYYSELTIIPSEENKDITIKGGIGSIRFLDKFTTPKNIYKMKYSLPNVPSQYAHLFQRLENE